MEHQRRTLAEARGNGGRWRPPPKVPLSDPPITWKKDPWRPRPWWLLADEAERVRHANERRERARAERYARFERHRAERVRRHSELWDPEVMRRDRETLRRFDSW